MSNLTSQSLKPLIKDKILPKINPDEKQLRIYLSASLFDRVFFNWITPIIKRNRIQPFEQEMHAKLRSNENSETQSDALKAEWMRVRDSKRSYPLLIAILKAYQKDMLFLAALGLISSLFFFSSPVIINLLMRYIAEPRPSISHVIMLAILIPFTRVLTSLVNSNSTFLMNLIGVKVKYSLAGLLYSKSLKISLIKSKGHSIGSIVNLYEIDCDKMKTMVTVLQNIIFIPIQIFVGIGIIYYLVGVSFLGGLAMMGIVSGISYLLSKKCSVLQEQFMNRKDNRMKLLNEILNGIRYIKMSGWEEAFGKKLETARAEELSVLKKRFIYFTIWTVNFLLGSQGVLMATLGLFLLLGESFDVTKIITMASTFWILSGPFQNISWVASTIIDSRISMRRIEGFLKSEDIDQSYITNQSISDDQETALKISNGTFSWEPINPKLEEMTPKKPISCPETPANMELSVPSIDNLDFERIPSLKIERSESTKNPNFRLRYLNLEVKKGSFVAVIGDIGSGKSSIFYSLLGEMSYNKEDPPQVTINGDVAFLPQKPWIVNANLRDNITFGKSFNKQLYDKVIHYAAMESDLKILENGDFTEIGEKGINLSGGQKARIGLARALYNESDIYLLDDVLSAVDVHVGTHIIEKCFTNYLSGKTRVLITHNLDYLKYVDYIYVMESGRIINEGSLEYLKTTTMYTDMVEKSRKANSKNSSESPDDSKDTPEEKAVLHENERSATHLNEEKMTNHHFEGGKNLKAAEKSEIFSPSAKNSEIDKHVEGLILAEDREKGNVKVSTITTFIECWGGIRFFIIAIVISLIKGISLQSAPLYLTWWGNHPEETDKFTFLGIYYFINIVSFVAQGAVFGLIYAQALRNSKLLHGRMVKSVLEAPLNLFFDRVPSGRILNRFSDDIDKIDAEAPFVFANFLGGLIAISINFCICISLSSIFMILPILGFLALCHSYYQGYAGLNREIQRLMGISNSPIVSHFSETLNGLSVIRSFSQEGRFFKSQMKKQDESVKNLVVAGAVSQWYEIRCCLASMLVMVPISVVILIWKEELGISVGSGGLLTSYLINICGDMSWFLSELASLEGKLVSLERCHKFTLIKSERIEPEVSSILQPNWPSKGEVKFRNYSTKYRPGLPSVLKQLNTTIQPTQKVGIIGRTGSGKSTLMLSLLRILEAEEGSIEVDGVSLVHVRLPHLRDKITVIPQDPQLFEGTLRENLDLLGQYNDEKLKETLAMVNLNNLVKGKIGLNLHVKAGGENLSAGERQMVCIARALLKQSKVILIDEATSNIDMNSEEIFLKTIKEKLQDCTVLTIAHRLKTIISSDRIIVMGEGRIIEEGSPEELLKREDSVFAGMWNEAQRAKQDSIQ